MAFFVGCCRFGISGVILGSWVNHAKMFPTLFVATSMGIAGIFSLIFVIAAPMVAELIFPIPVVIFTALSILAGVSSLFLVDLEDVTNSLENNNSDRRDLAVTQQNK